MDYKEKLRLAKEALESGSYDKETIEYIFPELRKSEDERIKEAIIATIHLYYGEPLEDEAKEMIAWLKKQGEQQKKHDVCDNCDQQGSCVSPCPMKLVEKQGEQKSEEVDNLHNYLYGEQKPTEWSKEDDSKLKEVLYYVEYVNKTNVTFQQRDLTYLINWLKSLRNKM